MYDVVVTADRAEQLNIIVGRRLEALIRDKGRSRRSVAIAIGLDPTSLMNYVRGERDIPLWVVVEACEDLGVVPYEFIIKAYYELGPIER